MYIFNQTKKTGANVFNDRLSQSYIHFLIQRLTKGSHAKKGSLFDNVQINLTPPSPSNLKNYKGKTHSRNFSRSSNVKLL